MVRLKELQLGLAHLAADLFQFHYGTIKSTQQRITTYRAWLISIPLWYD